LNHHQNTHSKVWGRCNEISSIRISVAMPVFYLRDASVDGVTYAMVISRRLGRTSSKEQYAYLYR